ncbi:hypothetical protein ACH4S9_30495 [Streptomyces sp. NPDC021225]|uniref:hypothetical protein n=1 Tax=Streptomyces sp. NPDC021225 TaxID=3365121 RepID=UPI0037A647EB
MDEEETFAPWGTVSPAFWDFTALQPSPSPTAEQAARSAPAALAASGPQAASRLSAAEPVPDPGPRPQPRQPAQAAPEPPPAKYRERVATVTTAFQTGDRGHLAWATIEADQLDQQITAEFGPAHPHTINMRELRGWLAHLMGHHATAARWYLHTTSLQAAVVGHHHSLTRASARRALFTWTSITDPQEKLSVGADVLAMLAATGGRDSKAARSLRARLDKLRAQH